MLKKIAYFFVPVVGISMVLCSLLISKVFAAQLQHPSGLEHKNGSYGRNSSPPPPPMNVGMDAYGKPVTAEEPVEKKERVQLRPGAYGSYGEQKEEAPLPDLPSKPAWSF